jgi:hypothetical protein
LTLKGFAVTYLYESKKHFKLRIFSMKIIGYKVIDRHTGQVIKTYAINKGNVARRYADKKDNEYGACRYHAEPILESMQGK